MSWFSRLTNGLSKTRKGLLFDFPSSSKTSHVDWDSLEFSLIAADVGMELSDEIINDTKANLEDGTPFQSALEKALLHQLEPPGIRHKLRQVGFNIDVTRKVVEPEGQVIMVVGVNGVGKTTTIAKLAHYYRNLGRSVMFGAADTFRAAAVNQLEAWAKKISVEVVKSIEGADPASVAYKALNYAKKEKFDHLIIDTAGRLQNKKNLMDEFKKIISVLKKIDSNAPQEIFLILDATTGQSAINQVEEFQKISPITGIIMTKLDGTAKGGILLAISKKFKLPIIALGMGEKENDLQMFDAQHYANAIMTN